MWDIVNFCTVVLFFMFSVAFCQLQINVYLCNRCIKINVIYMSLIYNYLKIKTDKL